MNQGMRKEGWGGGVGGGKGEMGKRKGGIGGRWEEDDGG